MATLRTSRSGRVHVADQPLPGLAYIGCSDGVWEDQAHLVWLLDSSEVTLGRGDQWLVRGSSKRLELRAPDARMSDRHARLVREDGAFVVEDDGSTNGTFVKGKRVRREILQPGDIVVTGRTFWRFVEYTPKDASLIIDDTSAAVGPTRTICPALVEQMRLLDRVARGRLPLLITGETGTGKEVVARHIHGASRPKGEFLAISCAAIPATLLERELFGHRRGAFTDAVEDRPGIVEAADGGSLLLDEVGDLPPDAQVKLLRVLQDGEVVRLGETKPRRVNVRLLAATHRNLPQMVEAGRFREDLYARLKGFTLRLPPLRDRLEDMGILLAHMLRRFAGPDASRIHVEPEAFGSLLAHRWRYNVRELERAVESSLLLARGGHSLTVKHVALALDEAVRATERAPRPAELSETDKELRARLRSLFREHRGNVSAVARAVGKSRTQVQRWIKRFGLRST